MTNHCKISKCIINMLLKDINLRIAISSTCNLNCIYCEGSNGYKINKPGAMEDFRRKPLKYRNLKLEILLKIIELFHHEGFIGCTLTGGEPLLNDDWDKIVNGISNIGMSRIEMTTNGTLFENYLKNNNLPNGLTLIKISLDTVDPIRFKKITRGGDINDVIKAVQKISPHIKMRANKVLLRSDLHELLEYFDFCHKIGFKEIGLLDLVFYSNRDNFQRKKFFEKEYISYLEIKKYLLDHLNIRTYQSHKYGHTFQLSNGLKIIIKDSDVAIRNKHCINCPIYCQEGVYTVRIATDGNITMCPDFKAQLPYYIDGPLELERGTLTQKIREFIADINSSKKIDSFQKYTKKNKIKLKNSIIK